MPIIYLLPLGLVIGAYGTLIGAGGGFILVPLLLFLYPHDPPHIITSISLGVVFFNALSGSIAYARQKRIDYRAGLLFAAASVPGAVLGALTTTHLSRSLFDPLFGALVLVIAGALFVFPKKPQARPHGSVKGKREQRIVDAKGQVHEYSYRPSVGAGLSGIIGYVSSLLGIGGGPIHVPIMVEVLGFPAHIAAATSHFVLAIMAFSGTVAHILVGSYTSGWRRTGLLAAGVVVGAQIGAAWSERIRGALLLRLLSGALFLVGVRLVYAGFHR